MMTLALPAVPKRNLQQGVALPSNTKKVSRLCSLSKTTRDASHGIRISGEGQFQTNQAKDAATPAAMFAANILRAPGLEIKRLSI